jgi:hypothetical protein
LCLTLAKGRFAYYFCLGGQRDPASCRASHVPVAVAEQLVARLHASNRLPPGLLEPLEAAIEREIRHRLDTQARTRHDAAAELRRVDRTREKLLAAYVVEAISLGELKREQTRLRAAEVAARRTLEHDEAASRDAQMRLRESLRRFDTGVADYGRGDAVRRRDFDHAVLKVVHISNRNVVSAVYNEPYATLVGGSSKNRLVGAEGLEPPTSSL